MLVPNLAGETIHRVVASFPYVVLLYIHNYEVNISQFVKRTIAFYCKSHAVHNPVISNVHWKMLQLYKYCNVDVTISATQSHSCEHGRGLILIPNNRAQMHVCRPIRLSVYKCTKLAQSQKDKRLTHKEKGREFPVERDLFVDVAPSSWRRQIFNACVYK